MDDRPKLCFGSLVCSCVVLLFFLCFGFFYCWFSVFFLYSFLWFLVSRLGSTLVFFFSFLVQFPQFFFFFCVSAQSSPFKTKTNGGKSTRICCWLSDQKFPWVLSLFVPSFFFVSVPRFCPLSPSFPPVRDSYFLSPSSYVFFVFSGFIATEFHCYQVINRMLLQE